MSSLALLLSTYALVARADVTVGNFIVDESCLKQQPNPGYYAAAAKLVDARADACLRRINREVAADLAHYLAHSGRLRVVCDGARAHSPLECAHVTPGTHELVLTHPRDCGPIENTLFHELLHLGTRLDDMTAAHHNNPSCRPYDAIYAAAELCFPSARTMKAAGIGWYGCKAAISDERVAERLCAALPIEFDQNYIDCRPAGL